jgi:hypothetical protein
MQFLLVPRHLTVKVLKFFLLLDLLAGLVRQKLDTLDIGVFQRLDLSV